MNKETEFTINMVRDSLFMDGYALEKSKDEKLVIKVNFNNKKCYLGSKYNVQRDIDSLISKIGNPNFETDFVIFGLAAGEHIIALLDILGSNNNIVVLEPDKSVLKLFLETDISKRIIEDSRIKILYINEENINSVLMESLNSGNIDNTQVLDYSNYKTIYEVQYNEFLKAFNNYKISARLNIDTLNEFSTLYFENYIKNFKDILESPKIDEIKNIFKEKAAIVVSAGPSLEKNIAKLKLIQDKFVIITGARTLRTLLSLDIKPDFVVMVDPLDFNSVFFKDLASYSTPLVYKGSSNHEALELYKGLKIYSKHEALEGYIDKILNKEIYSLFNGGSVAHACTDLAVYLGCSEVIFIGQDLAYTNNKYHSDTATYAKEENTKHTNELERDKKGLFYVEDIYGDNVLTDIPLNYYRVMLEEYIKENKNVKFINSTEGGANIKGTVVMTLEESTDLYGQESFNKELLSFMENRKDKINYKQELEKIKLSFENIVKLCNEGKGYVKKSYNYNIVTEKNKLVSVIKKLFNINKKIMSEDKLEFITILTTPIFNEVTNNPRYIPENGESISDTVEKVRESSKLLYEKLLECLDYAIKSMEKV